MDFIFLMIGVIVGIVTTRIHFGKRHIYGFIDVDEKTGQCRFHISREELGNKKNRRAIFYINHGVNIPMMDEDSRDELPL